MNTLPYSYVSSHLAEVTEQVYVDHAPLLVTRQEGPPVVSLSCEDFRSMEETTYLLSSPRNAERLLRSVASLRRG